MSLQTCLLVYVNSSGNRCVACKNYFDDVYVHACCSCICTTGLHDLWWDMIIENFSLQLYCDLSEYDDKDVHQILLGRIPSDVIAEHAEFEKLVTTKLFNAYQYMDAVSGYEIRYREMWYECQ